MLDDFLIVFDLLIVEICECEELFIVWDVLELIYCFWMCNDIDLVVCIFCMYEVLML